MRLCSLYLACIAIFFCFCAPVSAAGIKCSNGFQVVRGHGLVASPTCRNRALAAIARKRGFKVSANTLNNNYLKKLEICQTLGSDIRVQDLCVGVRPMAGPGGAFR